MENIFLPSTVEYLETDNPNVGKVVITPCHQGYGTTIGNALRRVLLSSIPGAAVEAVKIDGVQHEFSAIDGVQEDVVEILLNLKQLAIKSFTDQPVTLSLTKKGVGDVTAGDFEKNADIEIVNPDQKMCTITDGKKTLQLEITIGKGLGYVPASEKENKSLDLGTVLTDSFYSPVKDVGYSIENTRVGDITDFEKLIMTIETNGTITLKDAVSSAVKILIDHFTLFIDGADSGVASAAAEGDREAAEEKNEA